MRFVALNWLPFAAASVSLVTLTSASVGQLAVIAAIYLIATIVANVLSIVLRQLPHDLGAKDAPDFVLESFPVSPYVEKLRWSLDRLQVSYREQVDYGVVMWLRGASVPTLHFARDGHWAISSIANSRDAIEYLAGRYASSPLALFLQLPAGADPADADRLEKATDELNACIRRLFYHHVLVADAGKHRAVAMQLWGVADDRVPAWQRRLAPLLLPLQRALLIRALRLNSPTCRDSSLKRLTELFDDFERRIAASAHKTLLNTAHPTKFDFFLAIGVAITISSDLYAHACPNSFGAHLIRDMPALRADIAQFQNRPLAKWAEDIYRNHRHAAPGTKQKSN
jgi:hypothetical protein